MNLDTETERLCWTWGHTEGNSLNGDIPVRTPQQRRCAARTFVCLHTGTLVVGSQQWRLKWRLL